MFDDVKTLFFENIIPEYRAYIRVKKEDAAGTSRDISTVLSAARSLFHFREHVPEPRRKTRSALAISCPDYGLIGDISNVSKHGTISRYNPKITDAQNIYELLVVTEYCDSDGPYRIAEKTVVAELIDGTRRNIEDILTNVINMWIDELVDTNLIDLIDHFPERDTSIIPPREALGESAPLGINFIPGLRFKMCVQMMKYDYDVGKPKPVDLSGSSASMKIFDQRQINHAVDITFSHPTNGKKHEISVELSSEEYVKLQKFKTDEERTEFVFDLATRHGLISRKT